MLYCIIWVVTADWNRVWIEWKEKEPEWIRGACRLHFERYGPPFKGNSGHDIRTVRTIWLLSARALNIFLFSNNHPNSYRAGCRLVWAIMYRLRQERLLRRADNSNEADIFLSQRLNLKRPQVIETRAFPRIRCALITAKMQVKNHFVQYLNFY